MPGAATGAMAQRSSQCPKLSAYRRRRHCRRPRRCQQCCWCTGGSGDHCLTPAACRQEARLQTTQAPPGWQC
eukprot:339124-Chlamydomonas_euryale.AAC.2